MFGHARLRPLIESIWAWAILATVALFFINGFWLVRNDHVDAPPLPHGDGPDYESLAYSLSVGHGFEFAWEDPQWQEPYRSSDREEEYSQFARRDWPGPTTSRPPALPWLISQVYRCVPRGPQAFAVVRWLSVGSLSIAGGLAVWLAGSLVSGLISKFQRPARFGWLLPGIACAVAMGIASMDRTIKTYLQDFLTEPWAILGVMCLVICLVFWVRSGCNFRWLVAGGVSFGVMILIRSLFIFWLPVIVLGLVLVGCGLPEPRTRRWLAPWVFVSVVCIIAGPWWVRNCLVTHRWMPMGAQGAASLRGGYSDQALADGGNWHADAEILMQSNLDQLEGVGAWTAVDREVALADLASKETSEWIREHRWDLPRLGGMRLVTHWGPWRFDHLAWKFTAILGLLWIMRHNWRQGVVLASILIADALTTVVLYETGGRFLIPLHGLLYALGGVGLAGCIAFLLGDPVHPLHEETQSE